MLEELAPEKIVIFDANIPQLTDNALFNPELAGKISHTTLPICYLSKEAAKKSIKFITPDVYLNMDPKPSALLISHLETNYSKVLLNKLSKTVKPVILTCQESPFIATRFYLCLLPFSKNFKNSFVFSGMKKRVSRASSYQQMFFPQPYSITDFNPRSFKEKKLITMVSGAKSISSWKKNLLLKIVYGFNVKEIYSERLRAISYFAKCAGFDLFGRGWDKVLSDSREVNSYRGQVENKFEVIKNYKFVLCFENAIFPGYITEKIFDAIFAGCIPIYYGAPDIKNYIPENAFIDFRDYNSYEELKEHIDTIDEAKYNSYLIAMKDFIVSDAYKKFSQEHFSESVLRILEEEFTKK